MSNQFGSTASSGAGLVSSLPALTSMEADVKAMKSTLDKIAENQQEIMRELAKKRGLTLNFEGGDENQERGNWTGKLDFFLSCLGCAVGLGNVWRFPYLCYKNGGGAFLIPFLAFLVLSGMPIFLLELSLGQFTSRGPIGCWEFAPITRGLGLGMVLSSAFTTIYYNILMAWSFYYLFASFTSRLPWSYCGDWSSQTCSGRLHQVNSSCNDLADVHIDNGTGFNGTCWLEANGTRSLYGIYNVQMAAESGVSVRSESEEFLSYASLQDKLGSLSSMGPLRWDLSLCLILAWIIVSLSLVKGIKSSGKVVYFTALFPYAVLLILLVRGLTLPGAWDGVYFLLRPQLHRLSDSTVWKDAAVQVFYSLSTGSGSLITLASYNRFRTDVVRDTMSVVISDFFTSIFASVVVFSFLGFMAYETQKSVDQVVESGVGLAFIVYPQVLTKLPVSPLWAVLFFLMLITLGLDSQFVMVEAVITAIQDQWPSLRRCKSLVTFSAAIVLCIIGLSMCTPGGPQLLTIFDDFSASWNVMILSVLETLALAWIYGARRFTRDIELMTGPIVCGYLPWKYMKWWWIACWSVISPLFLVMILIFSWVEFSPSSYAGKLLPSWSQAIGWLITLSTLAAAAALSGHVAWRLRRRPLRVLWRPAAGWGPALPQFRSAVAEAGYAEDFVLDPSLEDWAAAKEPGTAADADADGGVYMVAPRLSRISDSTVYPL